MSREAVAQAILGASRITAICHENPDADTLGSALALRIAAERLGKQAEVVAADPVPPSLLALPYAAEVRTTPGLEPDLAVVLDGPPSRTGAIARDCGPWLERARIVNIDHHVSNDGSEAAVAWVDAEAAATCEMVALLMADLGVPIDTRSPPSSLPGSCRTPTPSRTRTQPRARCAWARTSWRPAPHCRPSTAPCTPTSRSARWRCGDASWPAPPSRDGRIVHATMTLAMLTETGTDAVASEGFIDLLASTKDADITVLFKEAGPSEIRVSIRTSARADAVAITSAFGGGGHARAAGCSVAGTLPEATSRVLAECERELDRADARGR